MYLNAKDCSLDWITQYALESLMQGSVTCQLHSSTLILGGYNAEGAVIGLNSGGANTTGMYYNATNLSSIMKKAHYQEDFRTFLAFV